MQVDRLLRDEDLFYFWILEPAIKTTQLMIKIFYKFIVYIFDLIYFQATVPRRYKERGKSAGQPMRSHTLTSRCLPLIYINTSVIRVFCPGAQDKQTATG